jgi:glutamate formiminotransferase
MESELIGLMPEEAAMGVMREALQIPGFTQERELESHLLRGGKL